MSVSCVCVCMPQLTYGGQRTTFGSVFFLAIMWVLGIRSGYQAWHLYPLSHLASPVGLLSIFLLVCELHDDRNFLFLPLLKSSPHYRTHIKQGSSKLMNELMFTRGGPSVDWFNSMKRFSLFVI